MLLWYGCRGEVWGELKQSVSIPSAVELLDYIHSSVDLVDSVVQSDPEIHEIQLLSGTDIFNSTKVEHDFPSTDVHPAGSEKISPNTPALPQKAKKSKQGLCNRFSMYRRDLYLSIPVGEI